MLIQDLDCLERVCGSEITGGIRPVQKLLLKYQNGNLSIKLGDKVLFEGKADLPNSIALVLDDIPQIYTSSKTEKINGLTQSIITISTDPLAIPRSSVDFMGYQ